MTLRELRKESVLMSENIKADPDVIFELLKDIKNLSNYQYRAFIAFQNHCIDDKESDRRDNVFVKRFNAIKTRIEALHGQIDYPGLYACVTIGNRTIYSL